MANIWLQKCPMKKRLTVSFSPRTNGPRAGSCCEWCSSCQHRRPVDPKAGVAGASRYWHSLCLERYERSGTIEIAELANGCERTLASKNARVFWIRNRMKWNQRLRLVETAEVLARFFGCFARPRFAAPHQMIWSPQSKSWWTELTQGKRLVDSQVECAEHWLCIDWDGIGTPFQVTEVQKTRNVRRKVESQCRKSMKKSCREAFSPCRYWTQWSRRVRASEPQSLQRQPRRNWQGQMPSSDTGTLESKWVNCSVMTIYDNQKNTAYHISLYISLVYTCLYLLILLEWLAQRSSHFHSRSFYFFVLRNASDPHDGNQAHDCRRGFELVRQWLDRQPQGLVAEMRRREMCWQTHADAYRQPRETKRGHSIPVWFWDTMYAEHRRTLVSQCSTHLWIEAPWFVEVWKPWVSCWQNRLKERIWCAGLRSWFHQFLLRLTLPFAWLLGIAKLFSVQEHHVLSRH